VEVADVRGEFPSDAKEMTGMGTSPGREEAKW